MYIGVLHHFKINPSARCMTADNLTCTNADIFSKGCFSFAHIFHVLRTRFVDTLLGFALHVLAYFRFTELYCIILFLYAFSFLLLFGCQRRNLVELNYSVPELYNL